MKPSRSSIKTFLVLIYGYAAAAMIAGLWLLFKFTVRISHVGRPADFIQRPFIECTWHESLLPYFVGAMPYTKPYVWMNHHAWYMKGVHLFLTWMGVRQLVLGSSGHGGEEALNQMAPLLQHGVSTFMNPDGPYGPPLVVKNGVLHLSKFSGLPVVAIRVICSRAHRLPTLERKVLPLPGSRITLAYSSHMHVTAATLEQVREQFALHLNG
jgi:lysophospholipid acyltransferase (LPLAT)-like uncharacterized protein